MIALCAIVSNLAATALPSDRVLARLRADGAGPDRRATGSRHRKVRRPKPNAIRLVDLEGVKKLIAADTQTKPLLVNFWATWCDPCRDEFPDLVKVDHDYRGKGLDFIAISLDDAADIKSAVPEFLHRVKATMPVYLLNVADPEPVIMAVDKDWGGALPATFLYDAQGKLVFKHYGRVPTKQLRDAIEKLVGRKQ